MSLALIGGTGLRSLAALEAATAESIVTRFGAATIMRGRLAGHDLVFLCRHGEQGATPPHRINYRANLAALVHAGVHAVIATTAVGGLTDAIPPGHFALADQFLDFTRSRTTTFFDESPAGPVHIDVSAPFCPRLRALLQAGALQYEIPLVETATYACAEGPRFETPAEIRMMKQLGADVVGMTLVPEVVLAREAGLCYANLSIVTNWAAGLGSAPLTHHEVTALMHQRQATLLQLLTECVARYEPSECACAQSLAGYDFTFVEFLRA